MSNRGSAFKSRFTHLNALRFAGRLHDELSAARENIYNTVRAEFHNHSNVTFRDEYDVENCNIIELREWVERFGWGELKRKMAFADELWVAQKALLDAQRVLK
jgi:hypothetical protein